MCKPGGQGRVQGDLGGLWLCPGLGVGAARGIPAGGTETRGRVCPQVRPTETPQTCFQYLQLPAGPCPQPPTPASPAASAGAVCWLGHPGSRYQPALGSFLPETRTTSIHITAKRDSPNLRPPQHCLHKSCAYFCIKSSSFQSYSNARNKRLL